MTTETLSAPAKADPALAPRIDDPILRIEDLSLWYGEKKALKNISMQIPEKQITAFIGPSGCGKSTLLRCINRLNDLIDNVRIEGDIRFEDGSIYDPRIDINALRKRIGMVFQKSNPFPKSIYENVAYGCRIQGINKKRDLDDIVEKSLRGAALWDEVKDRQETEHDAGQRGHDFDHRLEIPFVCRVHELRGVHGAEDAQGNSEQQ